MRMVEMTLSPALQTSFSNLMLVFRKILCTLGIANQKQIKILAIEKVLCDVVSY